MRLPAQAAARPRVAIGRVGASGRLSGRGCTRCRRFSRRGRAAGAM